MKKSDWIITTATLGYSYLFYQQLAGINFFVFSLLLSILLAIQNKEVLKDKKWYVFAALAISTSFFIMWHNSNLAIWANLCSLLLLSASSVKSSSSVIINGFYSMYSIAGSYVFLIINMVKRSEHKPGDPTASGKKGMNLLISLAVLVIAIIFFFIYKNANPLFEKFTEKINLDFISGMWIAFTIGGFFIVYGFFKHQRIQQMDAWEDQLPITLADKGLKTKSFEKTGGILLFIMLNVMLLFINGLDVVYLYVLNQLPEGITHTQFVHNEVGMIILSIVLGIGIILFLFRNAMNFEEKNKFIKLLITFWILQNSMMIVSTCLRNYIYVNEFNLTYKRIGVFVYLVLAIIGLGLTLYKIHFKKSNWFLLRTNALCCFLFLCVSSYINWDKLVCEYNIANKIDRLQNLDKKYLLSLSDQSIPYLQALKAKKGFDTDSAKADDGRGLTEDELAGFYNGRSSYITNSGETDIKTYNFLKRINSYPGWQSWNHRNASVFQELQVLNSKGNIESLQLNGQDLDSPNLLAVFNNVQMADLRNCRGNKFSFLKNYTKLKTLTLSGNSIKNLEEIPGLNTLTTLIIDYNFITSLKGLNNFPNVESLNISNTNINQLKNLSSTCKIRSLEADGCTYLKDLRGLNNLKSLEVLSLNQTLAFDYFPSIPSLKVLKLASCTDNANKSLQVIPVQENLEELHLSDNSTLQPEHLMVYDKRNNTSFKRFPKLKKLYAYSAGLSSLFPLSNYNDLEILQLNNNKIKDNLFMINFTKLKELSLSANALEKLEFNEKHLSLVKLNISHNEYLRDFDALKALSNLTYLDVSVTGFVNLNVLTCHTTLKELNIDNCRIPSLNPLIRFTNLQVLRMTTVADRDIEILKKLPSLKELYLNGSEITEQEIKELKKQLPNLKINNQ